MHYRYQWKSGSRTVTVSSQGSGYTYGNVDLVAGGVPTGTTRPVF
jgi:hypothetical protein